MKKLITLLFIGILLFSAMPPMTIGAADGITLYTSLTGVSLTPGENATYTVEVMNSSSEVKTLDLSVKGLKEGWQYNITSGGYALNQLSVKPNSSTEFELDLEVPLKVEKGTYSFEIVALDQNDTETTLPISITISETGVFKTELTSNQTNMQGDASSTFNYDVELRNRTAEEQHYALQANAPNGWQVQFKAGGDNVTSVTVPSNESETITVSVTPPEQVEKGTYEIPIAAKAGGTSSELMLEAVVTGTYDIELTTPDGRLSTDINAGDKKTLTLLVKNTGTSPLNDISLSSNTPTDWDVKFEPAKIATLEAGATETVKATITSSDNAIAGDYVVEMTAKSPEVSSAPQFRVSVKTSFLWGWIGVGIIVLVLVGIFFLVKKYGRR
jgi:uncharacterized membrane protein